uniref:Uncharacterized protein n=1 Tax=Calcidiscus leptoporus TaxID=127549 RepID=A0A7S0JAR8_9EUKA
MVAKQRRVSASSWWWLGPKRCRLKLVDGVPVRCGRNADQVYFQVARLSRSLARAVVVELTSPRGARAYNEALVGLVCRDRKGCRSVQLDPNRTNALAMGSEYPGYNAKHTHEFHPEALARLHEGVRHPLAGHLYHPAKCIAKQSLGLDALRWCPWS